MFALKLLGGLMLVGAGVVVALVGAGAAGDSVTDTFGSHERGKPEVSGARTDRGDTLNPQRKARSSLVRPGPSA